MIIRKAYSLLASIVIALFAITNQAYAETCDFDCSTLPDQNNLQACLKNVQDACESKLAETNVAKQTLQSAISYINSKMSLTQVQINQTKYQIDQLQSEIGVLDGNINTLDLTLDQITQLLSEKVVKSYKNSRINPVNLFISSNGFTGFISRYKYLKIAQHNDRDAILELERARANYHQQKTTKVESQQKVLGLQTELLGQKSTLDSQQSEKERLLALTKGDEAKYQQLRDDAAKQLAAFNRFVTSQGGSSILSNQTVCDDWGCYYNQRDALWGNMNLGISGYSVAGYGCLISAVSMMASHYGKAIKPSDIAANSSAFVYGEGDLLHNFSVNGVGVSLAYASKSILDSELAAGRPVIAGLYGGPDHFIVILRKEGDNYIMHDPYMEGGNEKPLTDKYPVSAITSLRIVKFN